MDATIHTLIAAQHVKDRIAEATGERAAREASRPAKQRRRALRKPRTVDVAPAPSKGARPAH